MRDDMKETTTPQLARLDDLDDVRIAEGDPDPRGWDVLAADGRAVGRVDTLIADTAAMKVRYLDVELDEKALGLEEERHILIPVGAATLHEKEDIVYLGTVSSARLRMLPPYRHVPLSRPDEQFYREEFDEGYAPSAQEADFYAHAHFDDRRFLGRRRRGDGAYLTRTS